MAIEVRAGFEVHKIIVDEAKISSSTQIDDTPKSSRLCEADAVNHAVGKIHDMPAQVKNDVGVETPECTSKRWNTSMTTRGSHEHEQVQDVLMLADSSYEDAEEQCQFCDRMHLEVMCKGKGRLAEEEPRSSTPSEDTINWDYLRQQHKYNEQAHKYNE